MKLSDIAEINGGINLARIKLNDGDTPIKLITTKSIKNNTLNLQNTDNYNYTFKAFNKDKLILKNNDIILNLINGKCYVFHQKDNNHYLVYQRFLKISVDKQYQKYLYNIIQQIHKAINYIIKSNRGSKSGIPQYSIQEIKNIEIDKQLFNTQYEEYLNQLLELNDLIQQEYHLKQEILKILLGKNYE